jgi:acyl-[acyl-carrier-protein]-phospholipid O-acyltransferase/long-chain-fatty-acid--[acyl-carrier-protein] ligase
MRPLQRTFINAARRHPFRFAMADARVPKLRAGAALTRTVFLARRLRSIWAGQPMVGILLPPSVAGALVNYAALLMGKVPVNLNYTASPEVIASSMKQCNLTTLVSSRAFLDRLKLRLPMAPVLLEDLVQKPRLSEKLFAAVLSWLEH